LRPGKGTRASNQASGTPNTSERQRAPVEQVRDRRSAVSTPGAVMSAARLPNGVLASKAISGRVRKATATAASVTNPRGTPPPRRVVLSLSRAGECHGAGPDRRGREMASPATTASPPRPSPVSVFVALTAPSLTEPGESRGRQARAVLAARGRSRRTPRRPPRARSRRRARWRTGPSRSPPPGSGRRPDRLRRPGYR